MKLIRKKQLLIEGTKEEFKLISSIVFHGCGLFSKKNKWKVQDDREFLTELVKKMLVKDELSAEDLAVLRTYEAYYLTLDKPKTREDKDAFNASQKDLSSLGNPVSIDDLITELVGNNEKSKDEE